MPDTPLCILCLREGAGQGGKVENAPTPATTPGAERKKGVRWGTVKTHKVYVIDSDGDDNGKEVGCTRVGNVRNMEEDIGGLASTRLSRPSCRVQPK